MKREDSKLKKRYDYINTLVKKGQKGCKDSKEKLIDLLQGLIVNQIKRYYYGTEQYKDLLQEGNLVVLECIDDFDFNRGVYFLGYVKTMLRFRYLEMRKEKVNISINSLLSNKADFILEDILKDKSIDIEKEIYRIERNKILIRSLEILTNRQYEIVYDFYFKDMKLADIASKYGIAYRTVVNTKTNALVKMKRHLRNIID